MINISNYQRYQLSTPSILLCIDKSISRWYGVGGSWINIRLPSYIAIDQKAKNGCEIQNVVCGKSGVMIRLSVINNEEDSDIRTMEKPDSLVHGTSILKYLIFLQTQSNRDVCTDSYFETVASVEEMPRFGVILIGVMKTETKILMKYLSSIEFKKCRGQREGMLLGRKMGNHI